jgi:hypothetical protein
MSTALIILEMLAIIAGLVAGVGALFYAFCWTLLCVVRLFPVIGRRHRRTRWDDLTSRSGRH